MVSNAFAPVTGDFVRRSRHQPGVRRRRFQSPEPARRERQESSQQLPRVPPRARLHSFAADWVIVNAIHYRVRPEVFDQLRHALGPGAKAKSHRWPSPPPQRGRDARDRVQSDVTPSATHAAPAASPVPSMRRQTAPAPATTVPSRPALLRRRFSARSACLAAAVCGTAYFAVPKVWSPEDIVRLPQGTLDPGVLAQVSAARAPAIATPGIPSSASASATGEPARIDNVPHITATSVNATSSSMPSQGSVPAASNPQPSEAAPQPSAVKRLDAPSSSLSCSQAHEALGLCDLHRVWQGQKLSGNLLKSEIHVNTDSFP